MVEDSLRSKVRRELGENEHEADWIISHVTKLSQEDFILNPREITDEEKDAIMDIVERRNSGEPLQYILGETEFMGLLFKVTEDTLIIFEAALDTDISYLDELGYDLKKQKIYKTNQHIFVKRSKR